MNQYKTYIEGTYSLQGDKTTRLRTRTGQRNHYFVTDIELSEKGFDGNENVGWKNLSTEDTLNTQSLFRDGCREIDGELSYVIDIELTATGFNGTQSVDWKCIYKKPNDENILIVFWGDSISGGVGLNSSATSDEIAPKPRVKIWDNINNDGFENLDIGVNNLLGHKDLETYVNTSHGWELELSNKLYENKLIPNIFLVKAGQGGSDATQWVDGTTYDAMTNFTTRVSGAISAIGNLKPLKIYLISSIGINNCIGGGISVINYYDNMVSVITSMKSIVGNNALFLIIKAHSSNANAQFIADLASINADILNLSQNITNVRRLDSGVVALSDQYHPTYAGMKVMADAWINPVFENYKYGNPIISA